MHFSYSLGSTERLLWVKHPHWYMLTPALLTGVGIALAGSLATLLVDRLPSNAISAVLQQGASWVPRLLWLAALWTWLSGVIRWRTTIYALTTERLLHLHGVLVRVGTSTPLHQINNLGLLEPLITRIPGLKEIFGFSHVSLETGNDSTDTWLYVPNGARFYALFLDANAQSRPFGTGGCLGSDPHLS